MFQTSIFGFHVSFGECILSGSGCWSFIKGTWGLVLVGCFVLRCVLQVPFPQWPLFHVPLYQHLQRGAKWFLKGVNHHPLGFNWHPLEGAGIGW